MHPEDVEGMANSVDTDQTVPLAAVEEQSDLGLYSLLMPICLKT